MDGALNGLLTGRFSTNVCDGVADTSHFLNRQRANAMIDPQVIPDLGSVKGVVTTRIFVVD
jgi:hypothetical protein